MVQSKKIQVKEALLEIMDDNKNQVKDALFEIIDERPEYFEIIQIILTEKTKEDKDEIGEEIKNSVKKSFNKYDKVFRKLA